jgi:transcriptional regulator with PAS, ATPase and Fis domain
LDPKRRHGPFIPVNCGAISFGLAESELFGHRRGAFTGADRDRKGLIRAAEGGVVFLDEIGELDDALQVKLLRVLQERRVLGVGDDHEVPVSVRVIAATNRNLSAAVQQGKFRADLFHRLNVLSIHIPPLRERRADVGPLIAHLLEKNQSLQTAGFISAGPDFVEALTRIDLPGNVRQLENLVRRALVNKAAPAPLTLTDLPVEIWQQLAEQEDRVRSEQLDGGGPGKPARETAPQTLSSDLVNLLDAHGWSLAQTLRYCERLLLEAALRRKQGNQSQTARLLGLTPRSIYSKIRRYHLNNL